MLANVMVGQHAERRSRRSQAQTRCSSLTAAWSVVMTVERGTPSTLRATSIFCLGHSPLMAVIWPSSLPSSALVGGGKGYVARR